MLINEIAPINNPKKEALKGYKASGVMEQVPRTASSVNQSRHLLTGLWLSSASHRQYRQNQILHIQRFELAAL